jgi:hypothetical protein
MTTIHIGSLAGLVVMLAAAVFLAAGGGGGAKASNREVAAPAAETSRLGVIDQGSALMWVGSGARCQGTLPRQRRARALPSSRVRVSRVAIVTLGDPAGAVSAGGACALRPPGPRAGFYLCPPGFWRHYRFSVSGGRRHTPALFLFPVGCGVTGRAGTVPAMPSATPLPTARGRAHQALASLWRQRW